MSLTDAEWLQRYSEGGKTVIDFTHLGGTGCGLRKSSLEKRARRLSASGYLTPYVHGGWELTEEGRRAIQPYDAGAVGKRIERPAGPWERGQ